MSKISEKESISLELDTEDKKDRCAFCAEQFDLFCAKAKKSIDFDTFWNRPPYKPDWCPGRTPTEEFHD